MIMAIPHGTAEQAKFKAYTAFSTGEFSSAVRHFSKAMSVGPSNYLLYSNRSATYARLGKYSEALADAVKTVQLKPGWPKGYFRLGAAHFGLGHFDEAVTAYSKGLECDPYDEGLKVGLAKAQSATSEPERKELAQREKDLGNSAYMMKDFDTAIAHYTKAIELNDEDISFLLNRARPYLKMGQYVECIKDCDKAVESGRKLRSDSKMIAIALTRKGAAMVKMAKCSKDYEPAIEIFQKALTEHHNPDTLKKLDDAVKAKRDLELQLESFDPKLADEEHKKELLSPNTSINNQRFSRMESSKASHSDKKYQATEPSIVVANPFNSNDGYNWHKYGPMQVKGSEYPQSYYKCTCVGCNFRKWVEQSPAGKITEIMYEGKHNHEMPQINKLAKEVSDLSGNLNSQAKPDLVLQSLAGNMNILSEFAPAYSVPEKNQESTVSTQTKRDREEEGVAETREEFSHSDGTYHPTIAVDTTNDGYKWRKYGKKKVNGSEYPRSNYRCAYPSCPSIKKVERSLAGHVSEIVYKGVHNHSKHHPRIKHAKEGSDLSGNINSQAKPDLGLQSQAGNWSKSSQVVPAYSVPERDQESTQTALTRLTGSRDSEGEGDAETIEEGDEPNPKRRMTDAGTSEVPLSHKTVTEPNIIMQTRSEVDLLDDGQMVDKGNPHQDEKGGKQIASEPHGMVFDVEPVKMTDSSDQKKFEIEEIGNLASQARQLQGLQIEEMQPQALSTQEEVFDVGAVIILKSSGHMESQIEDQMEPEASEQCGLFLMQVGLGLTKPPKDEDWKNAKEIYLMDNELSFLPENPMCPNLSALFLLRNYKLRMIPPSFFDYMPALQILNLSRTGIKSLPDSLFGLVSLKRLFLNDCHRLMMLSPKVGDLKLLEVLDLEGAKIMDLPMEIKELTNLTCLEVSFYGYMNNARRAMQSYAVVPCGVISALSQLEELNIDVNPDDERWDACVKDIVNEVCTLKRLETLKFYFPRVELLSHFQWNSPLLSHFRFTVGRHVKRIMSRVPLDVEFELERCERCLKYINGVGVPRDITRVLQYATAFFLDRHATAKKLSNFGIRNMEKLKCIVMGECNEVQVIIDEADDSNENVSESYGTEKNVLGSLEYLYVYYMKSLRSIWEGSVQQNSLFLLKSLTLRTCPQLTTIFTQGSSDNLCNLEELKVEDCPSIKSIVCCDIPAEHKTSSFLPKLKKISLHYMPGLVSISGGLRIAPKLEWLSFYNCPNLKNPLIDEVFSQDLKKIKGERSWWEALEWSNGRPGNLDEIFVLIDI